MGRPFWTMGFEPEHAQWPPLRLARVSRELVSVVVVSPLLLHEFNNRKEDEVRSVGRAIGLDVHRDFCEVAIAQDGEVRSAGRVDTTPERLELFGASLHPQDRVALEVSGGAWELARILERHVARVVVVSPADTGIRQARARRPRQAPRPPTASRACARPSDRSSRAPGGSPYLKGSRPRLGRRDVPGSARPPTRLR